MSEPPFRRPNVLIIQTDQQRWDALGVAGNPDILTPNLDRLAAQGVRFSRHFVQNPVCMPSRASFLSGQYPATIGITQMGVPLPENLPLIPHYLRPYGYRTANIGKLHALPHANRDHRMPHPAYGFDQLEISDEPGPYEDAYRAWVRQRAPDHLDAASLGLPPAAVTWRETMRVADHVVHPDERFPKHAVAHPAGEELTHTAFVSERTREFIRCQGDGPWFCIAGFYSPHSPWVVPQRYLDLYDRAQLTLPSQESRLPFGPSGGNADSADAARGDDELRSAIHGYYAMVSEVDEHVGRILATLDATGVADQTLVIFTSDHGDWLGKYGRYGKGHPADDTISRVPLIVRLPRAWDVDGGQVVDSIVEAVDVLPTILDVAAIQVPPALQGTSLLPLVRGEPGASVSRTGTALTEHHGWKTLRSDRFRYLLEADGAEYLFALADDPDELASVADDARYAEVLAEHRLRLLRRLLARERPRERTWTY